MAHAQRRALSTDRPDITESPRSVPAGNWQLEMDAAHGDHRLTPTNVLDHIDLATMTWKVGIEDALDVQLVWNAVIVNRYGAETDASLRIRAKWNLLGNDDEDGLAIGLLPWIALPPSDGEGVSVGLAVPIAFGLPEGFSAGAQVELDWITDGLARRFVSLLAVTTGHVIAGPLSGFVETTLRWFWEAQPELDWGVNGGLTVALSEDVCLDGGMRVHPLGDAYFEWWVGGSARGGL